MNVRCVRMLYFIAHVLSGHGRNSVDELRKEISSEFSVNAALRIPPHVTLFYPFETEDVSPLEPEIAALAKDATPFSLRTTGFGSFDEAVWFIDMEQAPELLALKTRIAEAVERTLDIVDKRKDRGTHFHMTLAYKDVTTEIFHRIGEFLKTRHVPIETLQVDSLSLLRHVKGKWETLAKYPMRR